MLSAIDENNVDMNLYKIFFRTVVLLVVLIQGVNGVRAQEGDQILDGIGETGLIARYVFDGDVKDWSRNNLHARIEGPGTKFINDNRFGKKVLSLSGANNI